MNKNAVYYRMLLDMFVFGYFCMMDVPLSPRITAFFWAAVTLNWNEMHHCIRISWHSLPCHKSAPSLPVSSLKLRILPRLREYIGRLAHAVQTASCFLLKHCDYSGKCQEKPCVTSHFLSPETAATPWRLSTECAPHWLEPDGLSYRAYQRKWKTVFFSPFQFCCGTALCVCACREIIP